jgi:hypothetical protein
MATEVRVEYRGWRIEPYTLLGWRGWAARRGAEVHLFTSPDEAKKWIDEHEGIEYKGWRIRKVEGWGALAKWTIWVAERGEDRFGFPTLEQATSWIDKQWPLEAERRRVEMMEREMREELVRRGVYERIYETTVTGPDGLRDLLKTSKPGTLFLVIYPVPSPIPSFCKEEELGRVYYGWEERRRGKGSYWMMIRWTDDLDEYMKLMRIPGARADPVGAEAAGKKYCVWIPGEYEYVEVSTHETPNVDYAARSIWYTINSPRIVLRVLVRPGKKKTGG